MESVKTYQDMSRGERMAYIDSCRHLFGTDKDKNISRLTGIPAASVASARARAGIPPYKRKIGEVKPVKKQKIGFALANTKQERQNERFEQLLRSAGW